MKQKWAAVLLALMMTAPFGARASFSPAWDALLADPWGVGVTVSDLSVTQLNASEDALLTLNNLLTPLSLSCLTVPAGDFFALKGPDMPELLCRIETDDAFVPLVNLSAMERLFTQSLPELFDALAGDPGPETEEKSTSFRVLGLSPARKSLTVSQEIWEAVPSKAREAFLSDAGQAFLGTPFAQALAEYLSGLTLQGDMTVRRNLDAAGGDMAFQFSGRVSSLGQDARKVSVVLGLNGDIRYLSLKAPAVRGKNNLQVALTIPAVTEAKKKHSQKITLSVKRVLGDESWSLSDTLTLTNSLSKGEEISVSLTRMEEENGMSRTADFRLSASPDEADGLMGSFTLKLTREAVTLSVWKGALRASPFSLDPAVLQAAAPAEQAAQKLLEWFVTLRKGLSYEEQRHLDHLLRTDRWMNGPSVSPLPENK